MQLGIVLQFHLNSLVFWRAFFNKIKLKESMWAKLVTLDTVL